MNNSFHLEDALALLLAIDYPPAHVHGRAVAGGREAWVSTLATWPPWVPAELAAIPRALSRRLLCVTTDGRQRLRAWLDGQRAQPSPVENLAQRQRRIADAVHFFGDAELFWPTVTTLASVPRPVSDHVLAECYVIVSGRSSAAWTSDPLPDGRLPIVLAGHRPDDQIMATLRHEVAHRWLIDRRHPQARTALQREITLQVLEATYTADVLNKFIAQGEREADWLAWSWSDR